MHGRTITPDEVPLTSVALTRDDTSIGTYMNLGILVYRPILICLTSS